MENAPANGPVRPQHHAVKFYGNDDSLFSTVAGFLAQGLVAGQPAIVVATEEHRSGIVRQLARHFVDVDRAANVGDLVLLDATELLSTFMRDGMPDGHLFQLHVGGLIERTLGSRANTVVRAYGEMVDLLWKNGFSQAAIHLEIMWNQLATQYGFALLCGYSMGHFYKQAVQYEEVCSHHSEVIADDKVVKFQGKRAAGAK